MDCLNPSIGIHTPYEINWILTSRLLQDCRICKVEKNFMNRIEYEITLIERAYSVDRTILR